MHADELGFPCADGLGAESKMNISFLGDGIAENASWVVEGPMNREWIRAVIDE